MTDANNYNLSNKLQRAQSWTVHFWSFKHQQSPTLIRGVIQTLSSILVKENLIYLCFNSCEKQFVAS